MKIIKLLALFAVTVGCVALTSCGGGGGGGTTEYAEEGNDAGAVPYHAKTELDGLRFTYNMPSLLGENLGRGHFGEQYLTQCIIEFSGKTCRFEEQISPSGDTHVENSVPYHYERNEGNFGTLEIRVPRPIKKENGAFQSEEYTLRCQLSFDSKNSCEMIDKNSSWSANAEVTKFK
ncbi:MAG: hypothetical protein IJ943_02705 [Akkermansia sp.]|nr:hypothetical protein [Akkermansia sp.]